MSKEKHFELGRELVITIPKKAIKKLEKGKTVIFTAASVSGENYVTTKIKPTSTGFKIKSSVSNCSNYLSELDEIEEVSSIEEVKDSIYTIYGSATYFI